MAICHRIIRRVKVEPYARTTYGLSTYTDSYGSYEQRFPAVQEQLSGILSVNGNRKIPNPQAFTKAAQFEMSGLIFQQFTDFDYFNERRGILPGFPIPDTNVTFSDSTYNSALSRLYDKIRGSADLAVDLAETSQTKAMMAKTVKGLASFTSVLGKMRRMRVGDAANAYLEWTYGWKPLASSIYETGVQLQKQLLQPQRSKLTIEVSKTDFDVSHDSIAYLPGVTIETKYETSQRVRMVTNWKLGNDMNEAIASFTSLNPVAVAWELVPYSFVVDWAVDIGGYLRNLESAALYNGTFLNGYITRTVQKQGRSVLRGNFSSAGQGTSYDGRASAYTRRKSRGPLTEAPFPVIPSFDLQLSFDRLTSGVALAYQAIGKLAHR